MSHQPLRLLPLLLAACTPTAGTAPVGLGTSQVIRMGAELQPILSGAVGVSLLEVHHDARCPASVQCVRAGSADVVFGIRIGLGPTVPTTLRVGDREPQATVAGGLVMTIDSLTPYPSTATSAIPQSQYSAWVTFRTAPD